MKIVDKNTFLVCVNDDDNDIDLTHAQKGTVIKPTKDNNKFIIPKQNNEVYFKYGTQIPNPFDEDDWHHTFFFVKKSNILAYDTKAIKKNEIIRKFN